MDENRVEGAARNFGGKIQEAVGDFTGDADTQVRGKINQAAGRIQNAVGGASDSLNDLSGVASDFVRENPLSAIGLAAGVGLIIGLLMKR